MENDNKKISKSQDVIDNKTNYSSVTTQLPQDKKNLGDNSWATRRSKKEGYCTTNEVAEILKVTKQAVIKWRKQNLFIEDILDHNGVYWYSKERVEQLQSVYHKNWFKPHKIKEDYVHTISKVQNVKEDENVEIVENPQAIEMEKFVLSAMLLKDGVIIPNVAAILVPDDFYRPEHRLIFQAILKIHDDKKPVNIMTLFNELRQTTDPNGNSLLNKIGMDYILALSEVAHTTAYSEHYSKNIKEKSDLRRLISIAERIIENAGKGLKSPLDIIAEANSAFNHLSNNNHEDFFNIADYLKKDFTRDVDKDFRCFDRKSGFSNLDNIQLWKPGLYILGATPACGKTTFAWQLLEQFAEKGEYCIFCSYEMSKKELAAKTLARRLFIDNRRATLTAADILNGGFTRGLTQAAFFDNEQINFEVRKFSDESVDKLLAILRPRVLNAERPPIICIDYLQRLIPRDHKAADTRALIDDALFKLKDFSQETNATILAVSTFNRTNYNQFVSFESFKESGGIEYTADVVWAMQLAISNKLSGEKESDIRRKIEDAKKQQPRDIQLTCLKNRQGNNYNCFFKYYSAHDYFQPCTEFDFISKSDSATNDKNDDEEDR